MGVGPARTAGGLLLAALLACGGPDGGYRTVSFQPAAENPAAGPQKEAIRLGMAPILSARAGGEGLTLLAEALSRRLQRPVVPILGSDYREVNAMLAYGQAEAGVVCTGAFSDPQLCERCDPLLVPLLEGTGPLYHGLVVVRKGAALRAFEDLEGKSFLFTDPLSLTGYLYPLSLLCERGRDPGSFFASVGFSHSHDRSLEEVARGSADGAAVDETVYLLWVRANPEKAQRLEVLLKSRDFPSPPVVVRKDLPAGDREALRRALVDLPGSPDGRAVLTAMGWTGFEEPDAAYLQRLQDLQGLFGRLHARRCLSP
ncbi:MAG: PhnD/SsuA/transferrin family substrate-binding protein [Acidobacteriota bacterium]